MASLKMFLMAWITRLYYKKPFMSAQDTYIEGSDIYIYIYIQVISGESYTFSSSLDLNRFNGQKYESINIDYHIIYYPLFS